MRYRCRSSTHPTRQMWRSCTTLSVPFLIGAWASWFRQCPECRLSGLCRDRGRQRCRLCRERTQSHEESALRLPDHPSGSRRLPPIFARIPGEHVLLEYPERPSPSRSLSRPKVGMEHTVARPSSAVALLGRRVPKSRDQSRRAESLHVAPSRSWCWLQVLCREFTNPTHEKVARGRLTCNLLSQWRSATDTLVVTHVTRRVTWPQGRGFGRPRSRAVAAGGLIHGVR